MKLALVTGVAGFVGRHMARGLRSHGWIVHGVDTRSSGGVYFPEDARKVFGATSNIIGHSTRYDLVVHCAYHVGGRAAIDGKPSLLALNLELDSRMFAWAVRTMQHAVMYFSSSAAYPTELQQAGSTTKLAESMIQLDHVAQPDGRYGWAKLTGEQLAAAATADGLRVHVLRPFSGYGTDQDMTYPFPAIVSRARRGDLSVWGPRGQKRDWIHIDDVIGGALAAYDQDYRLPVNLCTGVGTEFGDLAVQIAKAAGVAAGLDRVVYQQEKPTGVMVRVGDPKRMLTDLYQPKITIEDGIRMAIERNRL